MIARYMVDIRLTQKTEIDFCGSLYMLDMLCLTRRVGRDCRGSMYMALILHPTWGVGRDCSGSRYMVDTLSEMKSWEERMVVYIYIYIKYTRQKAWCLSRSTARPRMRV